jgi:ubiquinone/menaquinone biosynthesis C-methylase UbiE
MRILDLGCGSGKDLAAWDVTTFDKVTGLDIDGRRLVTAREQFPHRTFVQAVGEYLPFPDDSFDHTICSLALPYMNIQKALAEIHRVLALGGRLSLSLHLPGFTLYELLHNALPKPVPTLFRLYVAANGTFFHCTGKTIGFPNGRTESFQTERGMKIAFERAGFATPAFSRVPGAMGMKLQVETQKTVERDVVAVRKAA